MSDSDISPEPYDFLEDDDLLEDIIKYNKDKELENNENLED